MKAPYQDTLKLVMIKSKTNSYISDNVNNENYFRSKIPSLYFDGVKLEVSYNNGWFKVDNEPVKIEQMKPSEKINQRYELKEGYPESELTPKVVPYGEFYDTYEDVSGLYTYKFDEVAGGLEELEFEINIIEELDTGFEMKQMKYTPQYNFLDRLETHPAILSTKPCKLSLQQSYDIIRNHIKNNIDSKYARITSDYDFCLTVKKVIDLYEPRQYQVDLNAAYKRRKPKYETRYQRNREVTVFEIAPKSYQNYTIVTPFSGRDYDDLINNIDTYLDDLMSKINEPLKECECCKGNGVIFNDHN